MLDITPFVNRVHHCIAPEEIDRLLTFFHANHPKIDSCRYTISIPQCPATWGLEHLKGVPSNIATVGYTPDTYYLRFTPATWRRFYEEKKKD